jgi:PII-like signaling protein
LSPLYLAIVEKARETGLAGATVLRGLLGFGRSSRLHQESLFTLNQDAPVVVEIVDSEETIAAFLPILDAMMESGLVTLEKAQVLQYGRTRSGFLERLKDKLSHHAGSPAGSSRPAASAVIGPSPAGWREKSTMPVI